METTVHIKKTFSYITILLAIILMLSSSVLATQITSKKGWFEVTYPEKVSVFEPFTVHVKVLDDRLLEADKLYTGGCELPLTEEESFNKQSTLNISEDGFSYVYKGEKEFDVVLTLFANKALDLNNEYMNNGDKDPLATSCGITFHNDEDFQGMSDEVGINVKVFKYDLSVDVPGSYSYDATPEDLNVLSKMYRSSADGEKNSLSVHFTRASSYEPEHHHLTWTELEQGKPTIDSWMQDGVLKIPEGVEHETFTINGYPAHLYELFNLVCRGYPDEDTDCITNGWQLGIAATEIGLIHLDTYFKHDTGEDRVSAEARVDKWRAIGRTALQGVTLTSAGHTPKTKGAIKKEEKNPSECTADDDCKEKYRCTACGTCEKETKVIDPAKITPEFTLKNELSAKKIVNSIHELVDVTSTIKATYRDDTGKKHDYCDIAAPGLDGYTLTAKMEGKKPYAGFTTLGRLFEERKSTFTYNLELKKLHPFTFHFSPNDQKKTIGELGDINENFTINVEKNGEPLTENKKLSVLLTEPKRSVEFKTAGLQVQDGHVKSIKVKVSSKTEELFMVSAAVQGPGTVFTSEKGEAGNAKRAAYVSTRKTFFNAKKDVWAEFGYQAPEMSNTNFAELLKDAKTLGEAYTAAGKAIAIDTAFALLGEGADRAVGASTKALSARQGLSQSTRAAWSKYFLHNPGKYSSAKAAEVVMKQSGKVNTYKSLYKVTKGIQHAARTADAGYNIPNNLDAVSKDFSEATPPNTHTEPNWKEKSANIGVKFIDFTQATVGVLTAVPNKIPVLGSLSTAAKIKFSVATNLLKENFKYLAGNEKLKRAKELFFPAVIVVTVEDESGWQTQHLAVMKIAYQRI